jgi:hypothetical protein
MGDELSKKKFVIKTKHGKMIHHSELKATGGPGGRNREYTKLET